MYFGGRPDKGGVRVNVSRARSSLTPPGLSPKKYSCKDSSIYARYSTTSIILLSEGLGYSHLQKYHYSTPLLLVTLLISCDVVWFSCWSPLNLAFPLFSPCTLGSLFVLGIPLICLSAYLLIFPYSKFLGGPPFFFQRFSFA